MSGHPLHAKKLLKSRSIVVEALSACEHQSMQQIARIPSENQRQQGTHPLLVGSGSRRLEALKPTLEVLGICVCLMDLNKEQGLKKG